MWGLSEGGCGGVEVWWWWGFMFRFPQSSESRGLKETRRWRGARHRGLEETLNPAHLRVRRGVTAPPVSRGGVGVVFQPRRGVAPPPQPPPFAG